MASEGRSGFTLAEARQIGEVLSVDWTQFDVKRFRLGLDVELERGADGSSIPSAGQEARAQKPSPGL